MFRMQFTLISALVCVFLLRHSASAWNLCLPLGPIYEAPRAPSKSPTVKAALSNLTKQIIAALGNGTALGQLDPQSTSFSLDVYSLYEEESLFTHHFSAPDFVNATEGVKSVNSSTIYRLGSMSKLISVYTFLIAAGDSKFRLPVTPYVAELAEYATQHASALRTHGIEDYDWESITLEALASQLAGLPRDFAFGPRSDAELASLGLPVVPPVNGSFCGPTDQIQLPCNRTEFFENLFSQYPVVPSFHTPVYSNIAYQLLGYALESITGKKFPDVFNYSLIQPLGLNATSYAAPPSSKNSIVPYNSSWSSYAWDFGDESPAAGFYSNINDLRKIGKSMLNSTLISSALTRRWMKPTSFTGSINMSVGAPWEIIRAPTNHTMWMYTKGGHVGTYATELVLLPELGLGFTVLTAGVAVSNDVDLLTEMIAEQVIAAVDEAGREEAKATYVGTYTAPNNSSITITIDDGPGLRVTNWTLNGNDMEALAGLLVTQNPDQEFAIYMYPTTLTSMSQGRLSTSWRASIQRVPPLDYTLLGDCISWFQVDQITYGEWV